MLSSCDAEQELSPASFFPLGSLPSEPEEDEKSDDDDEEVVSTEDDAKPGGGIRGDRASEPTIRTRDHIITKVNNKNDVNEITKAGFFDFIMVLQPGTVGTSSSLSLVPSRREEDGIKNQNAARKMRECVL